MRVPDESRRFEASHRFLRVNLCKVLDGSEAEWKLRKASYDAATRIRSPIPVGTKLGVGMPDRLDDEGVGRGGGGFEPNAIG
jgi:hypothetical protein